MVIDLILLILVSSMFFIFLSSQTGTQTIESGVTRAQSTFIQRLLITNLNYKIDSGSYANSTVAELISEYHCGNSGTKSTINSTIKNVTETLAKEDHHFIFMSETSSLSRIIVYDYADCVKTEEITVARTILNLPCGKNATIVFGIWPASQEVQTCD